MDRGSWQATVRGHAHTRLGREGRQNFSLDQPVSRVKIQNLLLLLFFLWMEPLYQICEQSIN